MKVLLDTNIIIHRESFHVQNDNIGQLFWWLETLGYKKCVHQITRQEINKHRNTSTSRTLGIKLESYHELKTQAPITPEIQNILTDDQGENDRNDTLLLNEVLYKRVDILLTEDNKIHAKAERLNISEKVLKIDDFLHEMTVEHPSLTEYKVLSVRKEYFGNLNIGNTFFDSFKEDYLEFETWFEGKVEEPVYISVDGAKGIVAILYLKLEEEGENYTDIIPPFQPKKRLKIGTFKVETTGHRLGERFLKIIFDNALKQGVEEIYVTIFDDSYQKKKLVNLLKEWGFVFYGEKSPKKENGEESPRKEKVYVRKFARYSDIENIKGTYPFMSQRVRKFIVPIRPEYHTDLLPDSILSNEKPENFLDSKEHRNAIHKVYISRSFRRDLRRGDVIIFYRTKGESQLSAKYVSVVTTIGIVDSVIENISDEEKFIQLCRRRSVFSAQELSNYWNNNKSSRPFIVNFLYVHSFSPFRNLKILREKGIIEEAPRGFEQLPDEKFAKLMEITNANHLIVD